MPDSGADLKPLLRLKDGKDRMPKTLTFVETNKHFLFFFQVEIHLWRLPKL